MQQAPLPHSFSPVLKNTHPRGKSAPHAFKSILSPHFSEKYSNQTPPSGVKVSFQSWEVGGLV